MNDKPTQDPQDVIDRRLTTRLAANRLEKTDRHCRRLLERYREHGPLSLVNRRRGQPGNRQLMPGLDERVLRIILERYANFGPTLACEKLAEVHGCIWPKRQCARAGLWIPRKLRPPRVHQPRPRRACTGELIQIDGCEHRWFELQDRLVKELRLRGINTLEAANAFAEEFMADYNRRFAKPPRHDFDVHRPLENIENLEATFTWREQRKVSKSLTLQYDKKLYLLEDNEENRRFQGKYIDVWQYPDGTIELRAMGSSLPFITYDRLQDAIVDNKRLGRALEMIKLVQDNLTTPARRPCHHWTARHHAERNSPAGNHNEA